MATGGPGAGSKLIGGAHIRLAVDLRAYNRGLLDAQKALAKWVLDARQILRLVNISPLVRDFTALARAIWSAARAMAAFNRAMGGSSGNIFRGLGAGISSVLRGLGSGIASILRGFGAGLGSAFRGAGSLARGLGAGLAFAARGFANLLSAPLRLLSGSIRSIGTLRLPSLGGLAALGAGVGVAFSLKYVLDQAEEMEHTLVRLQRVTGGTRAEVNALGASFNEMGSTLAGVSLENLYEISIMGSKLGVNRTEIGLFTRDMGKVKAVIEDIPVEELTTYISGLQAVFGLANSDAIRLASALNRLDIESNASGRDILDITARLSGMAATMGLTVQKTLALSAAMRQGRVPIETAGTAMSQIFGRMAGKDLPNFARVAGMTTEAFRNLVSQDALEALIKVEEALGRLDQFGRIRALETLKLDGQRVRLVMLQLIPLLPQLRSYLQTANEEWETSGSILKGFALQAETARGMIVRMWNNVQLLGASLGTFFLPILKGVVNGISSLSYDIRTFVDSNGEKLAKWGQRVGRIFENLAAVTRIDWKDAFGVVGAAAKDIWAQFKANATTAFANLDQIIRNLIANIPHLLAAAFLQVVPAIAGALATGVAQGINKVLAAMPAAARRLMGLPANIAVAAGGAGALPQGPAWNAGLKGLPGMQIPDVLKMIPDMFARGGAAQRQDLVKRQALGGLQDWIARKLGGGGANPQADPLMGRLRGLAALEGAAGGGMGLGAGGAGGGIGGPLEAGGGGIAGGGGKMAVPMVAPQAAARSAGMPEWMGVAATAMGIELSPNLHQRKLDLLAWRARVAGRRGQRAPRMGRREALRRLEAQRRARMEGRMGVAEEVGEGIAAREREHPQFGLRNPGMGMGFRFGLPGGLGNVVPRTLTAQQNQPLVGLSSWGNTAVGKIVGAIENLNDTIERRLSLATFQ